jgi:hypothetical protein
MPGLLLLLLRLCPYYYYYYYARTTTYYCYYARTTPTMPVLLLLRPAGQRGPSGRLAEAGRRLAGGWPRLAEARGSLRRALALKKNTNGDPQRQLLAKA